MNKFDETYNMICEELSLKGIANGVKKFFGSEPAEEKYVLMLDLDHDDPNTNPVSIALGKVANILKSQYDTKAGYGVHRSYGGGHGESFIKVVYPKSIHTTIKEILYEPLINSTEVLFSSDGSNPPAKSFEEFFGQG